MKKYFYLVILLLAFFPSLVLAKVYKQEEVEKGSYIIGKYLFNKNKTTNYNGTLTTPMIMLSSKTIDGNDLSDMKIYFKNSRGKWINAITGELESNVPSSFEIICINLDCQKNKESLKVAYSNYTKSDISNGVYAIGKYMFDKEKNTVYNGTLTTPMIMLASKTIDSNNLSDMIIYYKNSRGKWINAITGESQSTVPTIFNIGYIDLISINKPVYKLESTLSLSESSSSVTYGTNKTVTITKIGDGNLSCKSGDTSVAECSISGTTLTIIPKALNQDNKQAKITVTLSEGTNYKSKEITYTVTVNRKVLTCPSKPSDKTFNNLIQESGITCPSGSTIGGIQQATNAGTYNQTCTANSGYKFDNTCSIDWKINKKSSSLTLSKTSDSTTYKTNKTVTITKVGDGNLSCQSSNTNIATCSISGTTLTIIPKALNKDNQQAIITVNLGEGENYKGNETTYTLIVNRKNLTCPSSPISKEFNNSLQQSGITCPNGSTIGGIQQATNIGTYNITCTANNGYKFENDCSVSWNIISPSSQNKLASILTLNSDSGSTTYGTNKTVTITKVGDGNLSCQSSDTNVATCSISNNTLTLTPKALNKDNQQAIITVNLSEGTNYKSNEASYTLTVNRKSLTCPSKPSNKTYNSFVQESGISCPSGSTINGTLQAITAGTYNVTCTPQNGYKFENACSVDWKINKKSSTLSLPESSGSTTYGTEISLLVTKVGDGNLSCQSSDTNVATCSISGTTLTITPKANSEDNKQATITVNLSEGTNYKAKDISFALTVNRKTLTCPSKPSDKTFNNSLQQSEITCPSGSTAGGTQQATNAGTYNQTCTANSGYKFDNTCSVDWKINKKSSTLTLSETSGTTTYGTNKTVTITKVGDGSLTCQSSDTDVATCSISGTTLTLTPKAIIDDSKSATITVKIKSTDNYNSATKTYTLVVNRVDYTASSDRNIDPSKWVATDKLGRTIAVYGDSDPYKENNVIKSIGSYGTKKVGIFYWDWHLELQDPDATTENNTIYYPRNGSKLNKYPYNLSNIIAANPSAANNYNHNVWNQYVSKYYWWNEPIYGYYTEADAYVLRRQAELLADAGVDFIVLDCTNGKFLWEKAYTNIFKVFKAAKDDGINVPKIVFMLNFDGGGADYATQINTLYNKLYNDSKMKNDYQDLWFMMDGDNKPLILGGNPNGNSGVSSKVRSAFTFRTSVPEYTYEGGLEFYNEIKWGWLSTYPQAYYYDLGNNYVDRNVEQSTVGVAQNFSASNNVLSAMNGPSIMGRSYAPGYTYSYKYRNNTITIGDHPQGTLYGRNFEHQWEYVRNIDPNYVFVTGWNEWVAGREENWDPNTQDNIPGVDNAFPDQFNDEYSRDIEPSKGSLKDNYYYQLVSNVRKYKGADEQEKQSYSKTIDIYGNPNQWEDNKLISYNSYINKTAPNRVTNENTNSKEWGYDNSNYLVNETFRNDIRTAKVSYDSSNLYFYIETEDVITNYKDSFRLLIDTLDSVTNSSTENWNEFEYVINRKYANDDTFALERSLGNNNWEVVCRVEYNIVSNTLQIKVPLNKLNLNASNLNFNFKWADNNMGEMTDVDDIMSVYTDGDVAPGGRFAFRFHNK